MAVQTPFEYYSDEANYGAYQFITLKEVIDALTLQAMDDDDYLKNTKRSQMIAHAKNCIKDLTSDLSSETKMFEITVPSDLVVVFPQDYVNWVAVYVSVLDNITGSYRLKQLDKNDQINTAIGYLQDNDGEILFDNDGYILTSDATNAYGKPYKKYKFWDHGGQFGLDTSKLSEWGEFNVDRDAGKFVFSSDLSEKEVVIEYISDGLQWQYFLEQDIRIHKDMEQVLKHYIYYKCIATRRTVPANEKYRANQEYKGSLHKCKLKMMEMDLKELSRLMRQKSMIL